MGNLACHESLVNAISMQNGLIATVVGQLFLDDSACLSETFRSGFHEDGVELILIMVITECFLSILFAKMKLVLCIDYLLPY